MIWFVHWFGATDSAPFVGNCIKYFDTEEQASQWAYQLVSQHKANSANVCEIKRSIRSVPAWAVPGVKNAEASDTRNP